MIALVALIVLPFGTPVASLPRLLGTYAVGIGWAFGIVVILRPVVSSWWRAAVVGTLAVSGFILTLYGTMRPDASLKVLLVATTISRIVLGAVPAIAVWVASGRSE